MRRPPPCEVARAAVLCGLGDFFKRGGQGDTPPELAVGQRVRVTSTATLMHVPGHKDGFEVHGAVGTVLRTYEESNLSPNREVKVQFDGPNKKWVAHFESWELQPVAADD